MEELPWEDEVRQAASEAVAMHTAASIEPGPRDLILHPTHLWLTIHESLGHSTELDRALGMEANFAGTSFLTPDKLGKFQIGSELVTVVAEKTAKGSLATAGYDDDGMKTVEWPLIRSDPASSAAPGPPWADGGLPQLPRTWIDRGRIANLACERFWAQKTGREPVPSPSNLLMSGGTGTVADLVSSTERGVLITSLWYMLNVNPRTLLHTGLTRDGVFWIENGKIAYPVTNFRWNDSPISVLSNIDGMSESVRASPRESTSTNISVPALRVKEFQLSSVSDAV